MRVFLYCFRSTGIHVYEAARLEVTQPAPRIPSVLAEPAAEVVADFYILALVALVGATARSLLLL